MSYDYGSSGIEIPNPFRLAGGVTAVRGGVTTLLGVIVLFSLRQQPSEAGAAVGWLKLLGAVELLAVGLYSVGLGFFRLFRFYVGRGIPSDLSKTGNQRHRPAYKVETLKDMLKRRVNPTFWEPVTWLSRLMHSLEANLLFLAPPLRNLAQSFFETGVSTITLVLLFGLTVFSGATGLAPIKGTPVLDWTGWIFVVAILGVSWNKRPTPRLTAEQTRVASQTKRLTWALVFAILSPAVLTWLYQAGSLPVLPVSPVPWLLMLGLGGTAVCLASIMMVVLKKPTEAPPTNVSEFRDQWQESVHPMDIFRAFDMTMADFRFQEIPNRIYEEHQPHLVDEAKGSFSGSMIQETQPIPQASALPRSVQTLRQVNLIAGHAMQLAGSICFFALVMGFGTMSVAARVRWGMSGLILSLFGTVLSRAAFLLYSEVGFESRLLHFFVDNGTFTRSKLSTGMSVHDSTRSENELVRSSLTPWIFCSRVQSVTYAGSGAGNLEQHRYLIEMHKDDAFLGGVVGALRQFITSRQLVAGLTAGADFAAAGTIHQMNDATRPRQLTGAVLPEDRRPPALTAPQDSKQS